MTEKISSYRFGVGKYFHEKEVLSHLREELRGFSDKALVISGKKAMEALEEQDFRKCLKDAGVSFREELYVGFPNTEKVEYFSKLAREEGYGVLIGAGGGKIMDLSKAVANQAGLPLLLIPTTAATCAAFTPLSVLYTKEGKYDKAIHFDREVDVVLVDEAIMATQAPRFLAAGMVDAMAKYVEISHGVKSLERGTVPLQKYLAYRMAEELFIVLEEEGAEVCRELREAGDNNRQALSKEEMKLGSALQDCVFANIALTGIVSGMMQGRGQAALAHALYNFLRTNYTEESGAFLHGEIVGVGLRLQALYNKNVELEERITKFMADRGMPTSLQDLGIPNQPEVKEQILRALFKNNPVGDCEEAEERLRQGILRICQ
ncbi:iron-containing alcohol dehydrogenase [Oribacterium sinus]|uniref:iron-containing alcohol dehydrogenase n=1 Tax=Oribacterium sinus TaxID=237576 RepID=UPI0028D36981|nr:iron-containing alcohol dehydrogenase [Oribacterium sinus]